MQVAIDFVTMPGADALEGQSLSLDQSGDDWSGNEDYEVDVQTTENCSATFTPNADLSQSVLSVTMAGQTQSGTPNDVQRDEMGGTYQLTFQFQYTRPGGIADDRVFRVRANGVPPTPRSIAVHKSRVLPDCTCDFYVNDPTPETLVLSLTADATGFVDIAGGGLARGVYNVKITSTFGTNWIVIDCSADGNQFIELPFEDS